MKLKHFPASAFLSEGTFERLLRCSTVDDPEFENDLRTHYRRDWRVRVVRALRTPMQRRNEQATLAIVEKLEGLRELGKPGMFVDGEYVVAGSVHSKGTDHAD